MIVVLHGLLLIFHHENQGTLLIYPDHVEKRYFSKVRIFLRLAMAVFQQPCSICAFDHATLNKLRQILSRLEGNDILAFDFHCFPGLGGLPMRVFR